MITSSRLTQQLTLTGTETLSTHTLHSSVSGPACATGGRAPLLDHSKAQSRPNLKMHTKMNNIDNQPDVSIDDEHT